jgi:hypothetical protein
VRTMTKRTAYAVLVICLLAARYGRVVEAAIHNAAADFSISNGNPNGVWSYGWMPVDFSQFNLYTGSMMAGPSPFWYRLPASGDYTPEIWQMNESYPQYGIQPGQLSLHPSNSQEPSVLRFTAPSTGQYAIDGEFFPGDIGYMQVGVRQGLNWLWQRSDSGSFHIDMPLDAGTPLDFMVYGGYAYGNTPLDLAISTDSSFVPEPTSLIVWSLLGSLAVVVGWRRRKQKC